MTCIAAVADGKTVWMGGDSLGSDGWDSTSRKDQKVFKTGEWVMGFTTSYRMGQLLMHRFTPPLLSEGQDVFAYMVTDFIDAVRRCLKDGGFAKRDSDRESGGEFLVGFRGRLFTIGSDYQVGEPIEPYDAVGCGHAYAKGSLYSTPPSLSPSKRITIALEAASLHSNGVRAPFTILSTEAL